MKIEEIKEACGVPDELISVNKGENTAVIQVETLKELLAIVCGRPLRELMGDFQISDVLDDETQRKLFDELPIRYRFK